MMPELISPSTSNLRNARYPIADLGNECSVGSIVAVFEVRNRGDRTMAFVARFEALLGCAAFLTALTAAQSTFAAKTADFSNFSLVSDGKVVLPGLLYVPPEAKADPDTRRPLILFLHGIGEKGTNNKSQVNVNIDNLLAEAKRRGVYLYAPQLPGDWDDREITSQVMTMIDRAIAEHKVDKSRVYVTGLSSGGCGTWNMLSRYPDRFAAGIPICAGRPDTDFVPDRLAGHAIHVFHSRDDRGASAATTQRVINSILMAGHKSLPTYPPAGSLTLFTLPDSGMDLHYTEFPTGGHGIWATVYGAPEVYNWLFAHSLSASKPASH
jgi:predicted peptidase